MKWRYAMRMAVASSSRSRTTSCCPRTRTPLPARCSPVGAALKLGDRGGVPSGGRDPGAGFVTPSPISCHDIPPRAACPEPICRRTPAATTQPALYLTAHHHTRRTPLEARRTAAGVGDFHLAKNGDRKLAIDNHPPSPPPGLINEHLQSVVRGASRAEPERTRQHIGLEDRLKHDLHRSLHNPVRDRRNRKRSPLRRPGLGNEHPAGRQRTQTTLPQRRGHLIKQPGHPVLLDVGDGDTVDTRCAAVAAHVLPRPLQDIPAKDLVPQRVESSPGIGLGRPVQRMLQGTDRIHFGFLRGGTSQHGTHRASSLTPIRIDEAAALPSPAVMLSARLQQYYGRLRRPPGTTSISRWNRL